MKKVYKIIKFKQKTWLKSYIIWFIYYRCEQRSTKKYIYIFKKGFFSLTNNAVFGKAMENVRKLRDIKLLATERAITYLESELNYHTTKVFSENLLAMAMKKNQIVMSKPVYLELIILELSKMLMYEFWYSYVKLKNGQKRKLFFIVYIKTDDNYKNIAENVESRFDTSNLELDRPLPKGKNKSNWINEIWLE